MLLTTRFPILLLYIFAVYLVFLLLQVLYYLRLFYNVQFSDFDTSSRVFDYIVVGCGSAGAIIAKRLAEDRNITVLVLEAGQHGNLFMDIPFLGLLLQNSPFDWHYKTVPQTKSCLALNNNQSIWPMGKIVGGTGMLNNMIYVRGHKQDFEEWFRDKKGYNFEADVLPYFQKFESWRKTDEKHSSTFSHLPFTSILPKFILNGAEKLGFLINEDIENCAEGFGLPKTTHLRGARWTPSHSLVRRNQPNVILKTDSLVERVLFRQNFEAHGVRYHTPGGRRFAYASKGVVLSAGTVGTPKILMHSGVGPKSHLDELDMETAVDLPVGENLQDHVTTGLDLVVLERGLGIGLEEMLSPVSAFDYFWGGTGPWTTGGCEALAFLPAEEGEREPTSGRPELQLMAMPLGANEDAGLHLRRMIGVEDDAWRDLSVSGRTASLLPVVLHPRSRGRVRLRDADFRSEPLIDPNYLDHPHDVALLLRGVRLVRELVDTPEMRSIGAAFNDAPFPGCGAHSFDTDDYWECYVRRLTLTGYHPVGTCRMGGDGDDGAVVGFDFAVRGTNGLFVADGSVMPSLTSGNVNGAISMLAEMAADMLKLREYLSCGSCRLVEVFVEKRQCVFCDGGSAG